MRRAGGVVGKGECGARIGGVPRKSAPQRETTAASGKAACPRGCPQTHGKKFCQLKTFCVNISSEVI